MEQQNSFRKIVGWLTILSVPFAYANFVLTGMAGNGEQDMYMFLKAGEQAGQIMKYSWLSDMLGYYLLLVPAAFLIHFWLKSKNPYWIGIFTFCGLAYFFAGSVGAAMLAKTWPALMAEYASSSGIAREIYSIVFTNTTQLVYGGLWGYLEFLLAGIWWIGIGFTLRTERKVLGVITIILGLFTICATVGEIFSMPYVALTGMIVYLLLAPAWAGWLGISIIRSKDIKLITP
jgi:hypothetical protein